jgi:hypothetical protein
MTHAKDSILREIAREEARLRELDRNREEARARIASLRLELDTASAAPAVSPPFHSAHKAPQTPTDKVRLFISLFRGRPDVFPTRFVGKKTGKPGYAPACSNKWEPGLCALRTGGKCGECANQSFVPVGDQVVLDHLQGRHVMGVYPLLPDETCWLLAADFRQELVAGRCRCLHGNL